MSENDISTLYSQDSGGLDSQSQDIRSANEVFPQAAPGEPTSISRIQLILAEKRTSLAVMRTGIVVFTLPLSVVTVLIATSRQYDFLDTYHLIVPLLALCAGLVVLAVYLIHRSVLRIWKQDALMTKIKRHDPTLSEFYRDHL